jgi:catalase
MRTWLLAAALTTGLTAAAHAQGTTASRTVDVMNQLWGKHPLTRANHAKGLVTEGSFTPSPEAATLSKAAIFAGAPVPIIVRFSDSTGLPAIPDASDDANPHGMSIAFRPEGGDPVDLVLNSLGFFPVRTGEEFYQLLKAIADSPADAPKPTPFEQFLATHPAVLPAFGSAKTPTSLAREVYNGVDAFVLVAADGTRHPFRFKVVPDLGTEYMTKDQIAAAAPDALMTELPQRLASGRVTYHLMAQLAEPGDPTDDATKPWPADRKLADLGQITISKASQDNAKAQEALRLLPNKLEPGIELSDDPLILARVQAYVISFGRRAQ